MRKATFLLIPLLAAAALPAIAAPTVQTWWRFGETTDYYADSSGNSRRLSSAYSHVPWNNPAYGGNFSGLIDPNGVGGPLGASGTTSTASLRSGAYGTMICTMWNASGYVPPAKDFFIEIWALPHNKGYVWGSSGAWIVAAASGRGLLLQVKDDGTKQYFAGTILEGTAVDVGTPVPINTNAWTHLALVNDNGVVRFYVNGVQSGAESTAMVSAPAGEIYFGNPSAGTGYDGLMDECRICTFAPGTFSTNDFLLRPPGPQILVQPQSTVVWKGGPVPFSVTPVIDPLISYQWRKGGADLSGATAATLLVPDVTLADSGNSYDVVLSSGGINVTSTPAILNVLDNRTADVSFYRQAVTTNTSVIAFFPIDGNTGATLANVIDASRNGALEGAYSYDGRTNRAFGERALSLSGGGQAQVPNNPAFEFTGGNGTIEALVYLDPSASGNGTVVAAANEGSAVAYTLMLTRDGTQIVYSNDAPTMLSWNVPQNLVGRRAHLALVIQDMTNVTAYVDGQSLGTKAQTGFGPAISPPLFIGAMGTGAVPGALYRFNGAIDEVALYSSALPQSELQMHYSRYVYGTNVAAPSIVSQPASRTVLAGAAPILDVVVSGTLPISYQWKSNGVNIAGANLPTYKIVSGTAGTSATYTLHVTNAIGFGVSAPIDITFVAATGNYAAAVLQDGPSSYWKLNETSGTVAADLAGYNDATYSGAYALGQPGPFPTDTDSAVSFTGGSAAAPYSRILNPATPFTVECWVKPSQSGQIQRAVIGSQNRNIGRSGYAIYQGLNGNYWEVHMGDSSTVRIWMFGKSPVVAGRWYHVALVYLPDDPTYPARLYVNGVDDTDYANSYTTGGAAFLPNSQQPFGIASRQGLAGYPGVIDEVAFYNYAVPAARLAAHYAVSYSPASVVTQPENVTTNEWSTVVLSAGVAGLPNTYKWQKNGSDIVEATNADGTPHYVNGTTNTSLIITQVKPNDAGQYRLVISNPLGGATSSAATLTVNADTTKPTLAKAEALGTPNTTGGNSPFLVKLTFSERIDANTAGDPNKYTIAGVTISEVKVSSDWLSVFLVTGGLTPGQRYTVNVSGLQDQAQVPNVMTPGTAAITAPVLSPGLTWDHYPNVSPNGVANLISSPNFPYMPYYSSNIVSFDSKLITGDALENVPGWGAALGNNYGASVSGWITPTVTTNYYFFLASDDSSELWLSTSADPASAVQIAAETGCCHGFQDPGNPTVSVPIPLQAGTSYFIRALMTEAGGGDYVRVAWKHEGDPTVPSTLTPIAGTFLKSYAPVAAPKFNQPVISGGTITITWTGQGTLYESSSLSPADWKPVPGNPSGSYSVNASGAPSKFYRLEQ